MRTFKDAAVPAPREWSIEVDLALISQVATAEETKGVGLLDILDTDSPTAQRCARDLPFMGELLWQCVRQQAEGRSVGKQDFLRSLKGNAFTAAGSALQDAAVDFFDDQKRPIQAKILQLTREMETEIVGKMRDDAAKADPKLMAGVMVDVLRQMSRSEKELTRDEAKELFAEAVRARQSATAGNLPAGSESTPAPAA